LRMGRDITEMFFRIIAVSGEFLPACLVDMQDTRCGFQGCPARWGLQK
jgi:hypothetical protein